MSARLIVLLPVRNGENDLPGYFESVSRFADGVIALDDGSTDATGEILQREKLVLEILRNPRRATYVGWNDTENRSRLLDACTRHNPDWIFQLDADQILDESEALPLRHFVETAAINNVAYAFRVHRMIEDMQHFDKAGRWAYRLFKYQIGQRLPSRILHFEPVPTAIPHERWVRTRFRIKHRSGLTEAKRRARYEKYVLADPERRWQSSYENLLEPPAQKKYFEPFETSGGYVLDWELHEKLAAERMLIVVKETLARNPMTSDLDELLRRSGLCPRSLDLPAGHTVNFGVSGAAARYQKGGWSGAEPTGTWTDGYEANLVFKPINPEGRKFKLEMHCRPFTTKCYPCQHVSIVLNGVFSDNWTFTFGEVPGNRAISLGRLSSASWVHAALKLPRAVSSAQLGISADSRNLGLFVEWMRLTPE
jgi:glycosyltransferase involved in cell wall biosynthesis